MKEYKEISRSAAIQTLCSDTLWSDGESGFPPYAALILVYFTMSYKQLPKLPGNLDSIEDCYSSEIILFWAKILSERERERER